ncbi:MAG: tRNA (adenosine(37)-N6)-dimethylallyltransferase MiaA, partial [Eubacteriales bacterium]|nr:tRNA (adenosine(37)-N6)-dimethylallyltransferase MiaA [Eubacteriales bacterium]
MAQKIIVIAGPTAVGKTKFVIELAQKFHGEIVSCDSMQLYKYMDIGSAKPTIEEQMSVKHYLVDEIDPREPFSVAEYQRLAKDAIRKISENGNIPFVSGGTGLYLNSLVYDMDFADTPGSPVVRKKLQAEIETKGLSALYARLEELNPKTASKIDPHNEVRIIRALEAEETGHHIGDFSKDLKRNLDYDFIMIGLTRDREELYDRINRRVDILMRKGLVEEVKRLLSMGLTKNDISMKGIGYK